MDSIYYPRLLCYHTYHS